MGWLDEISSGMQFPAGVTVYRLRPKQVWDEMSQTYILGDWDDPDELELPNAYVDHSSTSTVGDATRTQALEAMSLFLSDPAADVKKGDRIRVGPDVPDADVYRVDGIPYAPKNPFTGWQPVREAPLDRGLG